VSDFLGRIAARAVGAPALAQPLVSGPVAGAGAGLEVVDEEVVVPGALASPAIPERPSDAADAEPASPDAVPAPAAAAEPAASIPPAAATTVSAAELPRPERRLPALEPAMVVPAETGPAAPLAEPPTVVSAVAVPVTLASPLVAAPAPASAPASVAAVRDEPPPVRVHIGRLEVRASLGEAPSRPQPLPVPSEPEGLSLSDYLRGKRG
jgi:hypothetical protein